jgi:predicted kinase
MKNKVLYIVRGCPGAGKSTFAKSLNCPVFEADMFFVNSQGIYNFDYTKIKDAHAWCQEMAEDHMFNQEEKIAVSNTFTQEWEMKVYYDMAKTYGYTVFSVIVENRHGGENSHGVPEDKVQIMKDRFEVKL